MLSHAPDTVHMQVAAVSDQQYEQGASIQTSSLELSVWPQRQQAPCMGSVHFEGFKGTDGTPCPHPARRSGATAGAASHDFTQVYSNS